MDYRLFTTTFFFIILLVHDAIGNCRVKVEKVGCFNDRSRPLNQLLVYRRSMYDHTKLKSSLPRLICDCAIRAHTQGHSYIGIQYYAECWSSSLKDPEYDRDGKDEEKCYNTEFERCSEDDSTCTGGAHVNFIYKIVYQDEVTSTTKTPTTMAATTAPCKDESGDCANLKSYCTNEYPNMLERCKKTCQQCK